jgi:hypothetical protein
MGLTCNTTKTRTPSQHNYKQKKQEPQKQTKTQSTDSYQKHPASSNKVTLMTADEMKDTCICDGQNLHDYVEDGKASAYKIDGKSIIQYHNGPTYIKKNNSWSEISGKEAKALKNFESKFKKINLEQATAMINNGVSDEMKTNQDSVRSQYNNNFYEHNGSLIYGAPSGQAYKFNQDTRGWDKFDFNASPVKAKQTKTTDIRPEAPALAEDIPAEEVKQRKAELLAQQTIEAVQDSFADFFQQATKQAPLALEKFSNIIDEAKKLDKEATAITNSSPTEPPLPENTTVIAQDIRPEAPPLATDIPAAEVKQREAALQAEQTIEAAQDTLSSFFNQVKDQAPAALSQFSNILDEAKKLDQQATAVANSSPEAPPLAEDSITKTTRLIAKPKKRAFFGPINNPALEKIKKYIKENSITESKAKPDYSDLIKELSSKAKIPAKQTSNNPFSAFEATAVKCHSPNSNKSSHKFSFDNFSKKLGAHNNTPKIKAYGPRLLGQEAGRPAKKDPWITPGVDPFAVTEKQM